MTAQPQRPVPWYRTTPFLLCLAICALVALVVGLLTMLLGGSEFLQSLPFWSISAGLLAFTLAGAGGATMTRPRRAAAVMGAIAMLGGAIWFIITMIEYFVGL